VSEHAMQMQCNQCETCERFEGRLLLLRYPYTTGERHPFAYWRVRLIKLTASINAMFAPQTQHTIYSTIDYSAIK
jgi:hypothetical protein